MEITFPVQHVIRQASVKFVKVPENVCVQILISQVTRQVLTPFMELMEEFSPLIVSEVGVIRLLDLPHHHAQDRHLLHVALAADVVERV